MNEVLYIPHSALDSLRWKVSAWRVLSSIEDGEKILGSRRGRHPLEAPSPESYRPFLQPERRAHPSGLVFSATIGPCLYFQVREPPLRLILANLEDYLTI